MSSLRISHIVERTGGPEGTLRMWERRHGSPAPEREAARICAAIAAAQDPALVAGVSERLDAAPALSTLEQLRLATAIKNRTHSYLR